MCKKSEWLAVTDFFSCCDCDRESILDWHSLIEKWMCWTPCFCVYLCVLTSWIVQHKTSCGKVQNSSQNQTNIRKKMNKQTETIPKEHEWNWRHVIQVMEMTINDRAERMDICSMSVLNAMWWQPTNQPAQEARLMDKLVLFILVLSCVVLCAMDMFVCVYVVCKSVNHHKSLTIRTVQATGRCCSLFGTVAQFALGTATSQLCTVAVRHIRYGRGSPLAPVRIVRRY